MNDKQKDLLDIANNIAEMDISTASKASIAFGITLAATRLGGASSKLDDVWRDLELQHKREIEAKLEAVS